MVSFFIYFIIGIWIYQLAWSSFFLALSVQGPFFNFFSKLYILWELYILWKEKYVSKVSPTFEDVCYHTSFSTHYKSFQIVGGDDDDGAIAIEIGDENGAGHWARH